MSDHLSTLSQPRQPLPAAFQRLLQQAHASWHTALQAGLQAMQLADPNYLPALAEDVYLPTDGRLFAAFTQPLEKVRYILIGEGPYPRAASATGMCFMDGAVGELWSAQGLAKPVNRATSLRNFMKMLLVADGALSPQHLTATALLPIAQQAQQSDSVWIRTLMELQQNLIRQGFLLLNATLVYRPHVKPLVEARAWLPFVQAILHALAHHQQHTNSTPATLVLWGKIAAILQALPISQPFKHAVAEHPYNLSFIHNPTMQALCQPMHLLKQAPDNTQAAASPADC